MAAPKKSMYKIVSGPTFTGWMHRFGWLLLIASVAFFLSELSILGWATLLVGLLCLLAIRGVLIDPSKQRFKVYKSILIMKFGSWKSLAEFDEIVLKRTNSTFTMTVRTGTKTSAIKTFDLYLRSSSAKHEVLLAEFEKYKIAVTELEFLAELLGLKSKDWIAELRSQNIGKSKDPRFKKE